MSNWGTRLAAISCLLLVEIGGTSLLGQPASAPKPPMFAFPTHVAATPDGHIYVTDSLRNRVHWLRDTDLDLAGGWGYAGSADGQFNRPMGIAVDGNGSVFVADTSNARIQKFDVAGSVFKAKWDGLGSGAGPLRRPVAVAVEGNVLQGNVYVLDAETFIVHKLRNDLGGYLGSLGGVRGTGDGEFSSIGGDLAGLAVDPAGNLYISDPGNHRIQKWTISSDPTGNIISATFSGWLGACTGGANCDTASQRSRGFSCTAATCTVTASRSGTLPGQFTSPAGLALDSGGYLFVADYGNTRIQTFDSSGNPSNAWGSRGSGPDQFRAPVGVAVRTLGGYVTDVLYVTDILNKRVMKFTSPGAADAIRGGDFQIGASLGYPVDNRDALVDVNPLFLMPPWWQVPDTTSHAKTRVVTLTFDPIALFHESLSLSLQCCWSQSTGQLAPGTAGISASLSDYSQITFPLVAGSSTSSSGLPVLVPSSVSRDLTITVNNAPTPGRYLLGITAENTLWGIRKQIDVGFEVVVIPPDNTSWQNCSRFTTRGGDSGKIAGVSPLSVAAAFAFDWKATHLNDTSIAIFGSNPLPSSPDAGTLVVDKVVDPKHLPLASNESLVVFKTSDDQKEVMPFNLTTCMPSGPSLSTKTNTSRIDSTTTDTLLFRSRNGGQWDDDELLNPAAFWMLFGGRQLTVWR